MSLANAEVVQSDGSDIAAALLTRNSLGLLSPWPGAEPTVRET
jgi:hypothetical protein